MSAQSTAARAASQVPGPMSVIVSKQNAPGRAHGAAGTSGSTPSKQPGVREDVRHDPVLSRDPRASPAAAHSLPGRAQERHERFVVDGEEVLVGVRLGRDEVRAGSGERSCGSRSARAGTSVAGVRTPTQISPARLV